MTLVQSSQTIGLPPLPERDPDHSDPEWFQRDLDDLERFDDDGPDPLPTERHRRVVPR